MTNWQDKVVRVMLAETSDLRELAHMVGHDPSMFWRDANFRQADLSGQDLNGLDFSLATLPLPPGAKLPAGSEDQKDDLEAYADDQLGSGRQAMADALADWVHAGTHLRTALDAFREATDAYRRIPNGTNESVARRNLAAAILLQSEAAQFRSKDAIETAEYELRTASKLFEDQEESIQLARTLDAYGMLLRFKSRAQDNPAAVETLQRAGSFFASAEVYANSSRNTIRDMSLYCDLSILDGQSDASARDKLRENAGRLEQISSPVTEPVLVDIVVAARIGHSAHRLTIAYLSGQKLGARAREDIRDTLASAMRLAMQHRLYWDWLEAHLCLTRLDALWGEIGADPAPEAPADLQLAQTEAQRQGQTMLSEGDARLRDLMAAEIPDFNLLDQALECYANAEDLYGLIEDVGQIEGDPGRSYAILRRGMAHLMRTADASLSAQAHAEACIEARFALDLAAANLAGRADVPFELGEALDAQAFGLRVEAHFSTKAAAVEALAEAAALHRRASRLEALPRAVSYRYRTHFFGADRESEERQAARPDRLGDFRARADKALKSIESRLSDRTSAAERAAFMAVLAEHSMSTVSELKCAPPAEVVDQRRQSKQVVDQAITTAIDLAVDLFMPLDWILLQRTRAQLRRIDEL